MITKLKHGTVDPSTGMVFWGYNSNLKSGEHWMSAEKFAAAKTKQKEWERRQPKTSTRKLRNTGSEAARRRSELDKRKRAEDPLAFRSKAAEKMSRWRSRPLGVVATRCRARLTSFLRSRGLRKHRGTASMLGCTWQELRDHIEARFVPGMNWDNRGQWDLDHVTPLSAAKTEDDIIRLCHYTNLQPLWKLDNQRKGSRLPPITKIPQP